MSITTFEFDNEDDCKTARAIHADMLEREGWTPKPDLTIWLKDGQVNEMREKLSVQGVVYREIDGLR